MVTAELLVTSDGSSSGKRGGGGEGFLRWTSTRSQGVVILVVTSCLSHVVKLHYSRQTFS